MNKGTKNILIVSGGSLPLPPVKGGAVESLVDYLFRANELYGKYNFYAASIYDNEAVQEARKYKNTKFIFIRQRKYVKKILLFISKVNYKLIHKSIRFDYRHYARKVQNYIKKGGIDIDYILIENNGDIIDIFTSSGAPVFYHIHNDYLNSQVEQAEKVLELCKGIIAVTNFIAEKVGTIKGGYKKTKVLLNCTELNHFNAEKYIKFRKRFRSENNIKDTDVVLIFAGRLHPTKGVKELLEAFNQVENDDTYLLIVGGDWYSTNNTTEYICEIRKLAEKKQERIIWTGYINSDAMPGYYASADIGIFPSIWEEPGSIAVLEAEAAGLPLIASQVGGIPENSSEETTIYISVNDKKQMVKEMTRAIKVLVADSELRKKMGKASLEYVKNRDIYNYYENFAKVLEDFEGGEKEEIG